MGKKITAIFVCALVSLYYSISACAEFGDNMGPAGQKPKLTKKPTSAYKTEDLVLKGEREHPDTKPKKLEQREEKQWWQWTEKDTRKEKQDKSPVKDQEAAATNQQAQDSQEDKISRDEPDTSISPDTEEAPDTQIEPDKEISPDTQVEPDKEISDTQ